MDFKERQKENMNYRQIRMEIEKWRRNFKLTKRKKTIKSLHVSTNKRYFMKNNYNFQRVSLFDILFCKSLQFSSV